MHFKILAAILYMHRRVDYFTHKKNILINIYRSARKRVCMGTPKPHNYLSAIDVDK